MQDNDKLDHYLTGKRCAYCERKFGQSLRKTKDHLWPKAKGGTNVPLNLIGACFDCNCLKNNMTLIEFKRLLERELKREYDGGYLTDEILKKMILNCDKLRKRVKLHEPVFNAFFKTLNKTYNIPKYKNQ